MNRSSLCGTQRSWSCMTLRQCRSKIKGHCLITGKQGNGGGSRQSELSCDEAVALCFCFRTVARLVRGFSSGSSTWCRGCSGSLSNAHMLLHEAYTLCINTPTYVWLLLLHTRYTPVVLSPSYSRGLLSL